MPLAPCPNRLGKLIEAANSGENAVAADALRGIARAFRTRRRRQTNTYGRLAVGLSEVGDAAKLDLIRECPICEQLFWAGRVDREACPKHSVAWRKREERRRTKKRDERKAKSRAKRKQSRTEKPLKFSSTTATICDAVFDHHRTTESVLDYCYANLDEGTYRGATIHRGIKLLVDAEYLNPGEEQEEAENRHYVPTEKLKRLRREMLAQHGAHYSFRRVVTESKRPATH